MIDEYSIDDLKEKARSIPPEEWFRLGEILAELKRRIGRGELMKFCRQELKIKDRKAYYLIEVYKRISYLDITPPDGLSWKKAVILLPAIKEEVLGIKEILEKATRMSEKEVRSYIKTLL